MVNRLPRWVRRLILRFEAMIEDRVADFARSLPAGTRVLDAGAGECRHAREFSHCRYVAVDLAVGDADWDYSRLDGVADLARLQLSDEEKTLLTEELNRILSYMEKLDELDTRDAEPTSHVVPVSTPFRQDEAEAFPGRDEILALGPDVKGGYFRVPKIIE